MNTVGDNEKLNEHTVICVMTKAYDEEIIRLYAQNLLKRGCRDFGFCGVDKDIWHRTFDSVDIELNNEKDWGTTWNIDSIMDIPDDICAGKGNILILCSDYETVRECRRLLAEADYLLPP